jgi:hypothetical protein
MTELVFVRCGAKCHRPVARIRRNPAGRIVMWYPHVERPGTFGRTAEGTRLPLFDVEYPDVPLDDLAGLVSSWCSQHGRRQVDTDEVRDAVARAVRTGKRQVHHCVH